jgi:hypothetical protein
VSILKFLDVLKDLVKYSLNNSESERNITKQMTTLAKQYYANIASFKKIHSDVKDSPIILANMLLI